MRVYEPLDHRRAFGAVGTEVHKVAMNLREKRGSSVLARSLPRACLLLLAALALARCGKAKEDTDLAPKARAAASAPVVPDPPPPAPAAVAPYQVSASGGLPASGPGPR